MDAVEKATDALRHDSRFRDGVATGVGVGFAERTARAVLDAVGYDALRAERYRYKKALEYYADYGIHSVRRAARAALDREDT